MVYRVYVEKKAALANEARALLENLRAFLGIESLTGLRLFNRYDLEDISRELFDYTVKTVLSEPQLDIVTDTLPQGDAVFAVEYLPGQYDQRADSAAQCVQILSQGERPLVRTARVYALEGKLTDAEIAAIKQYVINPVESREASLELPETLRMEYDIPTTVRTVEGFTAMDSAALDALRDELGLAMDLDDLTFLQRYFRDDERREPTITEIRVVDTYWSDHCRHTTFSTHIDNVEIDDPAIQAAYERYLAARVEVYGEEKAAKRPQTLMDIATIGAKTLKKRGLLPELDESEEINACSIHVTATVDDEAQDWLLMFKNETHNHPTEIEPFGGAATCIGGCIRDPLSGRAYVHQAMRVTGAGDPRVALDKTLPGNDHYHAMDYKDLQLFRQNFERTLSMIGEMRIEALASEEPARQNARRSLVANRNIPAGKIIDKDDLTWKRPAGGISPRHYYEVLGMAARADIEEDTVLQWAHLE